MLTYLCFGWGEVLGFALRAFCLLGMHSTLSHTTSPFCFSFIFHIGSYFCMGLAYDHNLSTSSSYIQLELKVCTTILDLFYEVRSH